MTIDGKELTIEQIIDSTELTTTAKVTALQEKFINVPAWSGPQGLEKAYDPKQHPVMDRSIYPDETDAKGGVIPVSRITLDLPRLAVKRMTELTCGIPIKRIYRPEANNEKQKEVAGYLEKIYDRVRIDSVNVERLNMLFAGCEFMTLWYAVESRNSNYGFDSLLKLRCRNFSPMLGDNLYPLFDEYGDMVAMSVQYTRIVGKREVSYLDVYTATKHVKYSNDSTQWEEIQKEEIKNGKIPAIYCYRPTPIWEDTAQTVYDMEWALSRNGNYLRKNSKPLFVVFANEEINYGNDNNPNDDLGVLQYPQGATAGYVTWAQAIDNLKFFIDTLRSLYFTQLQLPDWSYEKMSQQALSGESRKQLFIDAQMKVKDESGRILEAFDREINVVKSWLKIMLPDDYGTDIDALPVETRITPFTITDKTETVNTLLAANGNMPIMSQRESIEEFGQSDDVDRTIKEIQNQEMGNALDLSM